MQFKKKNKLSEVKTMETKHDIPKASEAKTGGIGLSVKSTLASAKKLPAQNTTEFKAGLGPKTSEFKPSLKSEEKEYKPMDSGAGHSQEYISRLKKRANK